jgi:hypothetical protein
VSGLAGLEHALLRLDAPWLPSLRTLEPHALDRDSTRSP